MDFMRCEETLAVLCGVFLNVFGDLNVFEMVFFTQTTFDFIGYPFVLALAFRPE